MKDSRYLLRLSAEFPTTCKELVTGWSHYIGIKDASSHEIGGIVIGEGKDAVCY